MAKTDKLAEVVALIAEREEDFRPIREAATERDQQTGESLWPLSSLVAILQITRKNVVTAAINRAKVAAEKANMSLRENFRDGGVFDQPGETLISKYAAYLFVMSCDPGEGQVGLAQSFFALQIDRQHMEDEKRLRTRLDVATENHKLTGVAKDRGVSDFQKFNGMGVQGLYGGLNVKDVKRLKGLPDSASHLDFAGSEELAANLFRITQARAALQRQGIPSEKLACATHRRVAEGVREAILKAGNTPPEKLPPARVNIDGLASQKRREFAKK